MGGSDLDTSSDDAYIKALNGKEYMPAVSPSFFTHFPVNGWNKNWIYRGDDWLYCTRWEDIIAMRSQVKMTEIVSRV
jgi:glucan endo-1,3-alpha-glucosidase